MKKTLYAIEKTKVALGLGAIFILFFLTTIQDKSRFETLRDSFSSVYKDRLMVESYIYEISNRLHEKKLLFGSAQADEIEEVSSEKAHLDGQISALVTSYDQTKLTAEEARVFELLKNDLNRLSEAETRILTRSELNQQSAPGALEDLHAHLEMGLNKLSNVQINEGMNLVNNTERIIAGSYVSSQLEIGLLIIVGLFLQAIIMNARPAVPKFPQNRFLN